MSNWQKPITTRRYIHPPKSEKLYALFAEGKLIFGDIEPADERENAYDEYVSAGIWFTRTNRLGELDFHNTVNLTRDDGIPVHSLKNNTGGLEYNIEAFSEFDRCPRCYFSLTVTNMTAHCQTDRVGFLLRTARECLLVNDAPNHYRPYYTSVTEWNKLPATWNCSDGILRDGERYVAWDAEHILNFDPQCGFASTEITLEPGESTVMYFVYGEGEYRGLNYLDAREQAIAEWRRELSAIRNLPKSLSHNSESAKMINVLVATLLQHFCFPKGRDYMIARQGGLSRMIWIYESMPVLEALSRLGNFDSYVEPIINLYFTECQSEDGEIVPFGVHWAMCTANALYSFAKYSRIRGKDFFSKYSDRAYRAFEWIKKTRASTVAEGNIVAGLFPPKRSCDDELVFQGYGNTDSFNIMGLAAVADTFEYFSDPRAMTIRQEYNDYLATVRKVWNDIAAENNTDELRVPLAPVGNDSAIERAYGFGHFGAYIANALDIPERDAERVINYYTRRGFISGGFYDKLPDKIAPGVYPSYLDENGRCLIWYVTAHEYMWFQYFMRHGMKDRAKEIIDYIMRYAMTKEYYMVERINERDPYFAPWSPNASANGRLINMLLDYYEE